MPGNDGLFIVGIPGMLLTKEALNKLNSCTTLDDESSMRLIYPNWCSIYTIYQPFYQVQTARRIVLLANKKVSREAWNRGDITRAQFGHVFGFLKWQVHVYLFNYLETFHAWFHLGAWGALSEDIIGWSMGFIRFFSSERLTNRSLMFNIACSGSTRSPFDECWCW